MALVKAIKENDKESRKENLISILIGLLMK
jgi:hypothetical protein